MSLRKKASWLLFFLLPLPLFLISPSCLQVSEKIGVIFVVHGGMDTNEPQFMWDASVDMFSFDPNHPVYKVVIWNSANWSMVLQSEFAIKFLRKYDFEYPRIGGTDPYQNLTDQQLADMEAELDSNPYGINFEVDWACWMCGSDPDHYPYPRYIYYGPDGLPDPGADYDDVKYCGEDEEDGPWAGCDPNRYDVEGPAERLLNKGVSRIIVVDLTVGGVRFYKTYDVVQMTKRFVDEWNIANGTSVPVFWVNDYSNLMERSYPIEPAGWTATLGLPTVDSHVLLNGSPNPVASDSDLTTLNVDAIEAEMSITVSDADTGILLLNHSLLDNYEVFDPKINDTLVLNKNIKSQLLALHPTMDPDNIIGAYMGVKVENPENGLVERTREMRGESLGYAWLYQEGKELPGDEWGYLYWDALEYLKNRGVQHIVIGFPQISTSSVLDMVEFPNQIGKEIGFKAWAKWETWDYTRYPGVGHPFTDYWGNWVDTECDGQSCCFTMGGCGDPARPYPPPRQTPIDQKRGDMDPSLAYEVSEYGHLGYDPNMGATNPNSPVQNQYTGTWTMYVPPDDDPRVGQLLAKHVLNASVNPMVYITTNEELKGVAVGESVTFEAHVTGGGVPAYIYEWSAKKEGDSSWSTVGENSSSWTWNPISGDEGIYDVQCRVTDSQTHTGEVIWEDFTVSPT